MNEKEIVSKIKQEVYKLLKNEGTGHDFFHIERVVSNVRKIISHENCNEFYCILLAYLHDVGDYKLHNGVDKTEVIIYKILSGLNLDNQMIEQIIQDIQNIGFQGGFNNSNRKIEVQIVQDADRLDALGAIGIARAFAYGGKKSRLLHDPHYKVQIIKNVDEYKNSDAPTIQHFYDKLLKLKDLMNTSTGKKLAEERHDFMIKYLDQFYKEWNA